MGIILILGVVLLGFLVVGTLVALSVERPAAPRKPRVQYRR